MDYKKILIPVLLLMVMASASAALTNTMNEPSGNTYTPNMGTDYIDITFTVIDSVNTIPIHTAIIQYATADGNVVITDTNAMVLADTNLSSTNCTFTTANLWTTPGAKCTVRYYLPTGNNQLPSQMYVMDVNVVGFGIGAAQTTGDATAIGVFYIDNRYVSNAVEGLLNILPIVLIAALIISIVLAMAGILEPKTVLIIAVGAVIAVIAVYVMAAIVGVLTP